MEHLNVNEKTMRVLIAVAMGDARTRDNVMVDSSPRRKLRFAAVGDCDRGDNAARQFGVGLETLLDSTSAVAVAIGGKGSVYAKAFLAGVSEDPHFLREALVPLCNVLRIDVATSLELVRAMQCDHDATTSLVLRALGTNMVKANSIILDNLVRARNLSSEDDRTRVL